MDLLVEKLDGSRYYLSQYKVLITDFEESAPSVTRNSKQIDQRNGSIDFGGWHTEKTISVTGYYRADDMDEEEKLREKLYALLSDPEGYYITQLKTTPETVVERPGETSGGYYDKLTNYPSHKRFLVYTEAPELELVGNVNGTLLYKLSVEFKTIKLPYGETPAKDVAIDSPYKGFPVNYVLASRAIVPSQTDASLPSAFMNLSEDLAGKIITTSIKVIVTNYKGKIDSEGGDPRIEVMDGWSTGNWVDLINPISFTSNGVYTSAPVTTTKSRLAGSSNQIGIKLYNLNATAEVLIKVELGTTASPWSPSPLDPEYYADRLYDDTPMNLLTNSSTMEGWEGRNEWEVDEHKFKGLTVLKRRNLWAGLRQPVLTLPYRTDYTWGAWAKADDFDLKHPSNLTVYWNALDENGRELMSGGYNIDNQMSSAWRRISFTLPASALPTGTRKIGIRLEKPVDDGKYVYIAGIKIAAGSTAYPWSPNPADPEYHEWLRKLPSAIAVPYAGSVPCNQLEQGFTIELTALSSASSLSFKIGDTELTYNGDVAKGDVFRFSGFSYTKNNLSIVDKTNKAYFVLRPDKSNRISCNVFGKIRVLGFQNFYA
ncbi:phage tail domain-containing protein [Lacticaseibacillus paracasei]|uniref:phage tail domain-containing protein n=1 Tax=Lacticaseibacillus paracasei TaxID=1597 RepID=UPI0033131609